MARMDELWKAVGAPGTPPVADKRAVKARVNAALDADRKERSIYMRKKVRTVIVAAAAAAVVAGSAFAVGGSWDMLQVFFQGDTSPAQEYVDTTVRSVRDENFALTVEGSVSDESTVYLIATVTANSEKAKEFLYDDSFAGAGAFFFQSSSEETGSAQSSILGGSTRELESMTENTRRFRMTVTMTKPAESIWVRLGYMAKDLAVEVPLVPTPTVTVELGVSGMGIPHRETYSILTVEQVTLSPFTCHIKCTSASFTEGISAIPRIFFRMSDGSIRTQSQMTIMDFKIARGFIGGEEVDFDYEFTEVQDLENIVSIIAFDVEYPLDGSEPIPFQHDPSLDPFTIPHIEELTQGEGFSIPVRLLTEKLGGTCDWDPVTGNVTCVYRGVTVVLRPGDDTATINGQPITMSEVPEIQNGSLTANAQLFTDAWGLYAFVSRSRTSIGDDIEITWGDWYIVP